MKSISRFAFFLAAALIFAGGGVFSQVPCDNRITQSNNGGWNLDNVGIHTNGALGVKPLHIMGWETGCVDPAIRLSYRDIFWGHLALLTQSSSTINYSAIDTVRDMILQADTNAGNIVITTRAKGKAIKFGLTPDLSGIQQDYERLRLSNDGYNTALDIKVPYLWQSPDYGNAILNFRITNSFGYPQTGAGFNWKMGIDTKDYNKFKISGNDSIIRNSFDTNFTTFSLLPSGKMGLGTGNPKSYFDIVKQEGGIFSDFDIPEAHILYPSISLQSHCATGYHTWQIENNCGILYFRYYNSFFAGPVSLYPNVTFKYNGNVGIGVSDPQYKLDIGGNTKIDGDLTITGTINFPDFTLDHWTYNENWGYTTEGRVGIGAKKINSGSDYWSDAFLSVYGKIVATELIILPLDDEVNWTDFVFNEDYKLMPLFELEESIKQNKHLPDIPSAEEVSKNGIKVGDMQAKLLQKIEELTLYVIDLKKENIEMQKQIKELKK